MVYEGDDYYGDVLVPLAEMFIREGVYAAPKLDLPVDILLAAVITAWLKLRDEVVGQDDLELARAIALRIPPDELTDEPGIPDEHVRDIVNPPAPQPRRGLFRAE